MNYNTYTVILTDQFEGSENMVNLKELRLKAGLTQEELASKCEIQRSTIAMIETGGNKPSFELALKLSKVLNCTVEELAGEQ